MLRDYSVSQDPNLIGGPFQMENGQNAASDLLTMDGIFSKSLLDPGS